jgi:hypothetical protein
MHTKGEGIEGEAGENNAMGLLTSRGRQIESDRV